MTSGRSPVISIDIRFNMMGYLYILRTKNNHYYIGSTNNIERRFFEHISGKTKSLKHLLPIKIVFSKEYPSIQLARKIEYKLKKLKSRKIIDRIVEDQNIDIRL